MKTNPQIKKILGINPILFLHHNLGTEDKPSNLPNRQVLRYGDGAGVLPFTYLKQKNYEIMMKDLFYKPGTNLPIVSEDGRPIIIITGYCKGGRKNHLITKTYLARKLSDARRQILNATRQRHFTSADCEKIPCNMNYSGPNHRIYQNNPLNTNSSVTSYQIDYLNRWIQTHILTTDLLIHQFQNSLCSYWASCINCDSVKNVCKSAIFGSNKNLKKKSKRKPRRVQQTQVQVHTHKRKRISATPYNSIENNTLKNDSIKSKSVPDLQQIKRNKKNKSVKKLQEMKDGGSRLLISKRQRLAHTSKFNRKSIKKLN